MGIIGNLFVSDFSFEVSILVADVRCSVVDAGLGSNQPGAGANPPASNIQIATAMFIRPFRAASG
jgi:hypothetical protein